MVTFCLKYLEDRLTLWPASSFQWY